MTVRMRELKTNTIRPVPWAIHCELMKNERGATEWHVLIKMPRCGAMWWEIFPANLYEPIGALPNLDDTKTKKTE